MSESDFVISFEDPEVPGKTWHGSMHFDPIDGCQARVITEYDDPRMHPREPLHVYALRELPLTSNLTERIILVDMDREGGGFKASQQRAVLTERFSAKIMVKVTDPGLETLDGLVNRFTLRSPIIFSFIDHHAYETNITKRGRHFSIKDRPYKSATYSSQIFAKIELDVGRSMNDASSGNIGIIEYSASATFVPRKPMKLMEILRCAQLVEKLLFILVGDHCGPMEVDVSGGRRQPPRAEIQYASALYVNDDVVTGIWRCWTLNKVEIDFGKLLDAAFVRYSQIEVPMELIIDAGSQETTQDKFFRLVRAMEAITRNLMPKGAETIPPELTGIEKAIEHDPNLKKFFTGRIKSIFSKPNSLGYGIDLAKSTFPFPGDLPPTFGPWII